MQFFNKAHFLVPIGTKLHKEGACHVSSGTMIRSSQYSAVDRGTSSERLCANCRPNSPRNLTLLTLRLYPVTVLTPSTTELGVNI